MFRARAKTRSSLALQTVTYAARPSVSQLLAEFVPESVPMIDGTTAVPAARFGADVLGVDIASNLVAAGTLEHEALA
jgi:hypothetical protein